MFTFNHRWLYNGFALDIEPAFPPRITFKNTYISNENFSVRNGIFFLLFLVVEPTRLPGKLWIKNKLKKKTRMQRGTFFCSGEPRSACFSVSRKEHVQLHKANVFKWVPNQLASFRKIWYIHMYAFYIGVFFVVVVVVLVSGPYSDRSDQLC